MKHLGSDQLDALQEVFGIGMGQAAAVLNAVVGSHVQMSVPRLEIGRRGELVGLLGVMESSRLSAVNLRFTGEFSGCAGLVFPEDDSLRLVSVLLGEESSPDQIANMRVGALTEIGNIVLNGIMGAIANVLGHHLVYSVPEFMEDSPEQIFGLAAEDEVVVVAGAMMEIEKLRVQSEIVLVLEFETFQGLLASIDRSAAHA